MKKNKNWQFGFTLIELMVVISIITLVAAFGLATNYRAAQRTARDGKRKSDLEQIRSALEMYRADAGEYPNSLSQLVPDYLGVDPKDPQDPDRVYSYTPEDDTYTLCAALEKGEGVAIGGCGDCVENCDYAVYSPGKAPLAPTPTATPTSPPAPTPTPTPTPSPGPTPTPTPTPASTPTPTPTPTCERRLCQGWRPATGCTVLGQQLFADEATCLSQCPGLAEPCDWECICP